MDQGWFYGMHRIPPPGQKDEMSVWSQNFQSCHVKTNWLPQQHLKWPTGVVYLPLCTCVRRNPVSLERYTTFLSPSLRVMLLMAISTTVYQIKNKFLIANLKPKHMRTPAMLISSIPEQTPSAEEDRVM